MKKTLADALDARGYTSLTAVQEAVTDPNAEGKDLLVSAQTGSGKTLGFGLAIAPGLLGDGDHFERGDAPLALVIAPTRELAKQIVDNLKIYAAGTPVKIALVVGGVSINGQINALKRGVDLLVATPGRLIDLMDRRAVRLDLAQFLVLDEADQMLDMGFIHALRQIAPQLPKDRQTMLFSATMPKLMNEIAATYLSDPVRVETSPPGKPVDRITQVVHFIAQAEKSKLLIELLGEHRDDLALVFSRTKHGAERLMKALDRAGFAAGSIHGNKSQGQRDRALKAFREGTLKVLVATDVAARGIHVDGLDLVINFDMPKFAEEYIRRIGRTGRAGESGHALSLVSADEGKMLAGIERLIKKQLPRKEIEGFEPKNNLPLKPKAKADPSKARNRRPQGGAGKSFGPKPAGRSGGRGRGGQGEGQGRGQGQGRTGRPAQRQSA